MTGPPDRDPQENLEQIQALARGPKGDPGQRGAAGQAGERGLPMLQARAVVVLFLISVALSVGSYLLGSIQATANEHKWCSILVLVDNASKAGPAPTTAYGLKLRADFHELRGGFGCG